jgi:nicotinamide-nucleotide amidase
MRHLVPIAEKIAGRLTERHETIAVTESSTGGLIAAALLAVPGASAFFLGGAVAYTRAARLALLGIAVDRPARARAAWCEPGPG